MREEFMCQAALLNDRLMSLLGQERRVQVEFLVALAELDERRLYLDLGYGSLWDYCMRALHLREGATFLRMHAIAMLRSFPSLGGALRDGRLCLTTLVALEAVLDGDNLEALVERAAYRSKAEVKQLVASLAPRPAPADSLRRAPAPARARTPPLEPMAMEMPMGPLQPGPAPSSAPPKASPGAGGVAELPLASTPAPPEMPEPPEPVCRRRRSVEMEPLSANDWLLRMRLSDRVKEKLETARALSSHALPDGSWDAVLEAALDCYIERLEKRRAAKTDRPRTEVTTPVNDSGDSMPTPTPATAGDSGHTTPMLAAAGDPAPDARVRRTIPAAVRRAVWMRDEGCCAVRGPNGRRCGSRWKLELDHILPLAQGGPSTIDNLRLACRRHNVRHAEHCFGEAFMQSAAVRAPRLDEFHDPSP